MKVMITGAGGKLGNELRKHFPDALCPTRKEMDVRWLHDVRDYMACHEIDTIIHCAASTDTKICEDDPMEAYCVNSHGTYNLMLWCSGKYGNRRKLVYISTDHIFDGTYIESYYYDLSNPPYKETDRPNPQGHYAKSKLIGEWFTLANPNNLVIRTSFMKDFKLPKAFRDKYWSGMWADDAAMEIAKAVRMNLKGIYHIGGPRTSIFEFVKDRYPEVKRNTVKDNPISRSGLPYLKDTSLDCRKWKDVCKSD